MVFYVPGLSHHLGSPIADRSYSSKLPFVVLSFSAPPLSL